MLGLHASFDNPKEAVAKDTTYPYLCIYMYEHVRYVGTQVWLHGNNFPRISV